VHLLGERARVATWEELSVNSCKFGLYQIIFFEIIIILDSRLTRSLLSWPLGQSFRKPEYQLLISAAVTEENDQFLIILTR